MTYGQRMRRVVLPQAIRVIIPPTGNEFIAMMKDTALVSFLGATVAQTPSSSGGRSSSFSADIRKPRVAARGGALCTGCSRRSSRSSRAGSSAGSRRATCGPRSTTGRKRTQFMPVGGGGGGGGGTMVGIEVEATASHDRRVVVRVEGLHKYFGDLEVLKGDRHGGRTGARSWSSSAGPGRGSPRCCAASTSSRIRPTGTIEVAGIRLEGGPPDAAQARADPAAPDARPAWCSSTSTSSRNMTALENVMEGPVTVKGIRKDDDARPGRWSCSTKVGPGRQGRRVPDPALRWPAAARGDRAGARDGARGDALRRADLGARPRADRRGARR